MNVSSHHLHRHLHVEGEIRSGPKFDPHDGSVWRDDAVHKMWRRLTHKGLARYVEDEDYFVADCGTESER
jgi:hypothetical protein